MPHNKKLRSLGSQKNMLLRYQKIIEFYLQHKTEDVALTVVWRKYVFPKFHISKSTLYLIIGTPIERELKKVEEQIKQFQP